jgi:hypothetical protein
MRLNYDTCWETRDNLADVMVVPRALFANNSAPFFNTGFYTGIVITAVIDNNILLDVCYVELFFYDLWWLIFVARATPVLILAGLLFGRARKISKSDYWLRHACPSVCPHATIRLSLGGFSLNLIF